MMADMLNEEQKRAEQEKLAAKLAAKAAKQAELQRQQQEQLERRQQQQKQEDEKSRSAAIDSFAEPRPTPTSSPPPLGQNGDQNVVVAPFVAFSAHPLPDRKASGGTGGGGDEGHDNGGGGNEDRNGGGAPQVPGMDTESPVSVSSERIDGVPPRRGSGPSPGTGEPRNIEI